MLDSIALNWDGRLMKMRAGRSAMALCSLGVATGFATPATAQSYPTKPIRVVIGAAGGSNTDFFFRVVAPAMGATLGQQLIADYRAGAGGSVAAAVTAKSNPDGYVLSLLSSGFVIQPAMVRNLPYDPLRDFTPIGLIVDVPQGLVVHPSLPTRTVKELIALARSRPGELNHGSAGIGTNNHLAGVLFNLLARTNVVHIAYKSSPSLMVDLIGGRIEMSFPSIPGALEQARNGRLRILAQTGAKRSATATDVPTMQEAGLAGFHMNSGFGFAGPANLPRAIVDRLNAALIGAVQDAANRKVLIDSGADPWGSTPEEHDAFNRAQIARWFKVTKQAGIKPE
jgi:tripartite-type tricarboxylate transporter receptor subunit TctC